jgi:hypothetical protein
LIVVLVALLARLASVTRRRRQLRGSMTEAQAREDAAPLTTAIQRRTVCERRAGDALLDASRARSAERRHRVLVAQATRPLTPAPVKEFDTDRVRRWPPARPVKEPLDRCHSIVRLYVTSKPTRHSSAQPRTLAGQGLGASFLRNEGGL